MQAYQTLNFSFPNTQESYQSTSRVWGKLTSLNPNLENVRLTKSIYTIGRGNGNDIVIDDIRLSNVHCILTKDENDIVLLEDMSSNGTYVENEKVGKRNSKILLPGEKIYLLHGSRVPQQEILGYVFSIVVDNVSPLKRIREYEVPELSIQIKQMKYPEGHLNDYNEDLRKCCQCQKSSEQLVTASPCSHTFCASCYANWMDKYQNCPQCCEEVKQIMSNTQLLDFGKAYVEDEEYLTNDKNKGILLQKMGPLVQNHIFKEEKVVKEKEEEIITEENVVSHDQDTDVSSNENSRNQMDMSLESIGDDKKKGRLDKLMKLTVLFDKFTAE